MSTLDGKTAIVTGGASGIGRASSVALAKCGAAVLVADINETGAGEVAGAIRSAGGRAESVFVDLAEPESIAAMVERAVDRFGGLHILHNNAANTAADVIGRDVDILEMDIGVWEKTMTVNLRAVMLGCKYALKPMLAAGGGSIINTSSAAGLAGDISRPAYGVSKGAVNTLTQYVATLYGKQGIRCNAIAPGVIRTPALMEQISPEQRATYVAHHLTPDIGEPEDIADAVVFLAGPESRFITGQIIAVDGGMMSHHPAVAHFRG